MDAGELMDGMMRLTLDMIEAGAEVPAMLAPVEAGIRVVNDLYYQKDGDGLWFCQAVQTTPMEIPALSHVCRELLGGSTLVDALREMPVGEPEERLFLASILWCCARVGDPEIVDVESLAAMGEVKLALYGKEF